MTHVPTDSPRETPARDPLSIDVSAAVQGDRAALDRVVRAVQPMIGRLALRFFACPEHARDATQEALVRIVTQLGHFSGRSAFTTWAYRVATNEFLSALRSPAERGALSLEAFDEELAQVPEAATGSTTPLDHDLIVSEVRVGCTLAMLLCLDGDTRLAYILGEIAELDHEVAAEILDCSAAAYRKRLERGRAAILGLMRRRCGVFDPNNFCRCARRVPIAIAKRRLDPKKLLFATSVEQVRQFPEVLEQIRRLDELRRTAAIYQSHPDPSSPADFAARLQEILGAGGDSSLQG
jgi:RNA polymerase sigma factor (sigma-70 family)